MRETTVAATQMACTWDSQTTLAKAEKLVREAADKGANIILLQELFETPYFCQGHHFKYFDLAKTVDDNAAIQHFRGIAKALQVVLPISFYEKAGNVLFNSVAVIDADGSVLGVYRKTHLPDGMPYAEKFYFAPGDTGFKVWKTRYATIGVGICWDQWFPESARCMALMGAELLFYPTAIGSEPTLNIDSKDHWQRAMQGHAAANLMPVIASNRIGTETETINGNEASMTFYGSSFITDGNGAKVAEAGRENESVLVATFDLTELEKQRRHWGVFRDRRPEHYAPMFKLDASHDYTT